MLRRWHHLGPVCVLRGACVQLTTLDHSLQAAISIQQYQQQHQHRLVVMHCHIHQSQARFTQPACWANNTPGGKGTNGQQQSSHTDCANREFLFEFNFTVHHTQTAVEWFVLGPGEMYSVSINRRTGSADGSVLKITIKMHAKPVFVLIALGVICLLQVTSTRANSIHAWNDSFCQTPPPFFSTRQHPPRPRPITSSS